MQEKALVAKIWNELIGKVTPEEARKDFPTYYKILVDWFKKNRKYFSNELISKVDIGIYLGIDPEKYAIDNGTIFLDKEHKSLAKRKFTNLESMALFLHSHLYDLTTIIYDICPDCQGDALRYMIFETIETKKRTLVLECPTPGCSRARYLDGNYWSEGLVKSIPASKDDLIEYGIDINKLSFNTFSK